MRIEEDRTAAALEPAPGCWARCIGYQHAKGRLPGIQEQNTSHKSAKCADDPKSKDLPFLATQVFTRGKCSSQISRTQGEVLVTLAGADGTPTARSTGKVISVPPPAKALTAPPIIAATPDGS